MGTTTVRVDAETHARLVELSRSSGASLTETVRAAVEALRRQRFAERVVAELGELSQDSQAWSDYVTDADRTSVADGAR